ncbi:hypothetical protein B0H12DRAFT_783506 [Mycena haematopus]|nr:hypothetical protein B0H12DRAFT_783506 [Mycena haematopus]
MHILRTRTLPSCADLYACRVDMGFGVSSPRGALCVLFRPPRLSPRIPDDSRVPHHTLRYDDDTTRSPVHVARPSTSPARPPLDDTI